MSHLPKTLEFYHAAFAQVGLYDVFPDLRQEVVGYADRVARASPEKRLLAAHGGAPVQRFEIPIRTGIGGEEYDVSWHVVAAARYHGKPQRYPIDHERIHSNPEKLNAQVLRRYVNDTAVHPPIVLAHYVPINKWLVVDGNHRYHALRAKGAREVDAILLAPEQHLLYMVSERMKTLYQVHHNLQALLQLADTPLAPFFSDQPLLAKTWYFSPNPVRHSVFSVLKLLKQRKANHEAWRQLRSSVGVV